MTCPRAKMLAGQMMCPCHGLASVVRAKPSGWRPARQTSEDRAHRSVCPFLLCPRCAAMPADPRTRAGR